MASIPTHGADPQKPALSSPGPVLVAYSDSDSESPSSETPDLDVDRTRELAAAEGLMALFVAPNTSSNRLISDISNPVASIQKQLGPTPVNEQETINEGSYRHDQAGHHDTAIDDDDDTIPDINNETQEIKFETIFADANDEGDDSANTPRCWGDIKYPRIGTCDHEFKIVNKGERYRKVVSDFFGRNKKATASVPPECYPTICRTCYQRLAYRLGSMNKDHPEKDAAAVAKLRCDAIISALEKMKEKKFVDRHGCEWPWWCGLELQLTNDAQVLLSNPEELEAEIDKKNGEVAKQKAEKAKSPKGKSFKRLHKRVKPKYLPDWLQKLCHANTGNDVTADACTGTIGDRDGVRYSFDELILIIKAIKTFCHESRCTFPTIEAIPVPIGLLDEQILKEKRKLRATANRMKTETKKVAVAFEQQSRDQPSNSLRKTRAVNARRAANDALAEADAAERAVDYAQEDAVLSGGTIPGKRRKSDATPGRAGKFKVTLKGGKVRKIEKTVKDVGEAAEAFKSEDDGEKAVEDAEATENLNSKEDGDLSAEEDDAHDEDFEEDARTSNSRPVKRTRTSTAARKTPAKPELRPNKGTCSDWKKKTYGNSPPPSPANVAELRARMAQAFRDGYGPVKLKNAPAVYSDESEND